MPDNGSCLFYSFIYDLDAYLILLNIDYISVYEILRNAYMKETLRRGVEINILVNIVDLNKK